MDKTTEVVATPLEAKLPNGKAEVINGIEKSASIKNLAVSLAKFQGKIESVEKDGDNPYFRSKYATLANIVYTIRPTLSENGLSFSQLPSGSNELVTILMHQSGEYLSSTVKMSPKDNTPQSQGSAITYMRRYALSAILGIVTDDDDDGNEATKPQVKKLEVAKPISKPVSPKPAEPVEIEGLGKLPPQDEPARPQIKMICSETNCGKEITEAERGYSLEKYGRALCRVCQKNNIPING